MLRDLLHARHVLKRSFFFIYANLSSAKFVKFLELVFSIMISFNLLFNVLRRLPSAFARPIETGDAVNTIAFS